MSAACKDNSVSHQCTNKRKPSRASNVIDSYITSHFIARMSQGPSGYAIHAFPCAADVSQLAHSFNSTFDTTCNFPIPPNDCIGFQCFIYEGLTGVFGWQSSSCRCSNIRNGQDSVQSCFAIINSQSRDFSPLWRPQSVVEVSNALQCRREGLTAPTLKYDRRGMPCAYSWIR